MEFINTEVAGIKSSQITLFQQIFHSLSSAFLTWSTRWFLNKVHWISVNVIQEYVTESASEMFLVWGIQACDLVLESHALRTTRDVEYYLLPEIVAR
jgi:hypothetical protein